MNGDIAPTLAPITGSMVAVIINRTEKDLTSSFNLLGSMEVARTAYFIRQIKKIGT